MKNAIRILLFASALASTPLLAEGYGLPPGPGVPPQPAPAPQPAPGAYAEIQIFFGYRGYNDYDSKLVSMTSLPLTLDYLVRGYQAAACYKGDPVAALELFGEMIRIYNYEAHRAIYFAAGDF